MIILGIVVGAIYGVLIAAQQRLPWPARILLMSMALVALVLASARITDDLAASRPWSAGLLAFAVATVATHLYLYQQGRRQTVPR